MNVVPSISLNELSYSTVAYLSRHMDNSPSIRKTPMLIFSNDPS